MNVEKPISAGVRTTPRQRLPAGRQSPPLFAIDSQLVKFRTGAKRSRTSVTKRALRFSSTTMAWSGLAPVTGRKNFAGIFEIN